MSEKRLASYIDHTCLKKEASFEEIEKCCQEAKRYGFKGICVFPKHLPWVKKILTKNSKILKVAVVDFPLGKGSVATKVKEAKDAIKKGADELDLVMDYSALKKKEYAKVFLGITQVVKVAKKHSVKVILETGVLTTEEKIVAAALAKAAGAAFVKTSTGFVEKGATKEDVALLSKIIGKDMSIKASGKVRSYLQAKSLIKAGASRIGSSMSVSIVHEEENFLKNKECNT